MTQPQCLKINPTGLYPAVGDSIKASHHGMVAQCHRFSTAALRGRVTQVMQGLHSPCTAIHAGPMPIVCQAIVSPRLADFSVVNSAEMMRIVPTLQGPWAVTSSTTSVRTDFGFAHPLRATFVSRVFVMITALTGVVLRGHLAMCVAWIVAKMRNAQRARNVRPKTPLGSPLTYPSVFRILHSAIAPKTRQGRRGPA